MMPSLWIRLIVIPLLYNLKKSSSASDTTYNLDCSHDYTVRKIPPLADSLKVFDPLLSIDHDVNMSQIQVLIRHGARTLINDCWENYNYSWDCNTTKLVQPSTTRTNELLKKPTALFRMMYGDGVLGTETVLNGTCEFGQITDEGYDQQVKNGEILLDAYICEGGGCLLKSNKVEDLEDISQDLWLTSDDVPRTIMSGQVLTSALFDTTGTGEEGVNILQWHTGDRSIEHMFDYDGPCPRRTELIEEWYNSKEYKAMVSSTSAEILRDSFINEWGVDNDYWSNNTRLGWDSLLDCVMTTVCTGRELPRATTALMVNGVKDLAERIDFSMLSYNSGEMTKVAFSPLFTNVREFALKSLQHEQSAPKFVLYSLHDASLMAVLALFVPDEWDRKWTPYASMVVIEVMHIKGKDYFRFVYNGKVLKLAGCEKDICPMDVLESITAFVTDPESISCDSVKTSNVDPTDTHTRKVPTPFGSVAFYFGILIGILIGLIPFIYIRKTQTRQDDPVIQHIYETSPQSSHDEVEAPMLQLQ